MSVSCEFPTLAAAAPALATGAHAPPESKRLSDTIKTPRDPNVRDEQPFTDRGQQTNLPAPAP